MDWEFFFQLTAAILFWKLLYRLIEYVFEKIDRKRHQKFINRVDRFRRGNR
jgi:hypothetical protein